MNNTANLFDWSTGILYLELQVNSKLSTAPAIIINLSIIIFLILFSGWEKILKYMTI